MRQGIRFFAHRIENQFFMKNFYRLLICVLLSQNCKTAATLDNNPPADGFNVAQSDARAIEIADEVMRANGGRRAYDATRFLKWNFFGSRRLTWDKWTGWVRIEYLKKPLKIIVNIHDGKGKVELAGIEQTHPDSLSKYLGLGKRVWINDSYWLVMPFKLKDSGVTLKFLGDSKTESGAAADLLQLTFQSVGVTPDNKYQVWVDKTSRRVSQWAFFKNFGDEKPQFVNAWLDYQKFGDIWLSGNRGRDEGNLTEIEAPATLPASVFEKF